MIIKSSTALRNNYGMISDLAHKEAEQREKTLKLRAKLEAAETARLSRAPAYTLVESRKRLDRHFFRCCRKITDIVYNLIVCIRQTV